MGFSVRGLATRQLADYRARTPGTVFGEEDLSSLTLEDAYAIQAQVARLRHAEGEPVAGYKVGATGAGMREEFGMDGPIRGFVYGSGRTPRSNVSSRSSSCTTTSSGPSPDSFRSSSPTTACTPVSYRVEINGRMVETGPMSGVPGGPAGSVEWLRRNLQAYGLALQPGQLVLTGTPLGLYPVQAGDSVRVTAGRLGSAEATIIA